MSQIIENLTDAKSALERTFELRDLGLADFFRGQTKQWPLVSSLARLNEHQRKISEQKLSRLYHWCSKAFDLPDLQNNHIKILAVAQHYGLPTTYLDFTNDPSVATFFATENIDDFNSPGCIFCLSRKEVNKAIEVFSKKLETKVPAILDIDVSNLWRLQAQDGLFMDWPFEPYFPLDIALPMRVLLFSHVNNSDAGYHRKRIYPDRKSKLEIRLDQFFSEECMQERIAKAKRTIDLRLAHWNENCHAFIDCQLPEPDESWSMAERSNWKCVRSELFSKTVSKAPSLRFRIPKLNENTCKLSVFFSLQLKKYFSSKKRLREYSVNFIFNDHESGEHDVQRLSCVLALYWDGVRQLPFSDEEVSNGFGNLLAAMLNSQIKGPFMETVFGEVISCEFSLAMQIHFRASISRSGLVACMRNDFRRSLDLNNYPELEDPCEIIHFINDIRKLFNFDQFRKLMISEIIPSQIIQQFDNSGYYKGKNTAENPDWISFNPLDVTHMRSSVTWMGLAGMRNRDRIISLHPDLTDNELKIIMALTNKNIKNGSRPSTITFSGYEHDKREIFDIPEVADLCSRLTAIGIPSVLEVTTMFKSRPDSYNPLTLGAFEIWLLANKKFKKEIYSDEAKTLLNNFLEILPPCNQLCEETCAQTNIPETSTLDSIISIGVFGRRTNNRN